jgi:hypothetical protein
MKLEGEKPVAGPWKKILLCILPKYVEQEHQSHASELEVLGL